MDELKFKIALEGAGFTWEQGETILAVLRDWDYRDDQILELENALKDIKGQARDLRRILRPVRTDLRKLSRDEDLEDLEDLALDIGLVQEGIDYIEESTERMDA